MIQFKHFLLEKRKFEKMGDHDTPWKINKPPFKYENELLNTKIRGKRHDLLSKEANEQENKSLQHKHLEEIESYKSYSADLNRHLRKEDSPRHHYEDRIKHLDHVTSHKTKHDFHVYRGSDHFNLNDYPIGSIHHDKGYTGTTLDQSEAKSRGKYIKGEYPKIKYKHRYGEDHHAIFKIHVKPGTKGHYLDASHRNHVYIGEKEFLLHRGTKFKVSGHSYDPESSTHYVHMDVHSQENHKDD